MRKGLPAYHILAAQHHLQRARNSVVTGDKTSTELHMKYAFIHIEQYFYKQERNIIDEIEDEIM